MQIIYLLRLLALNCPWRCGGFPFAPMVKPLAGVAGELKDGITEPNGCCCCGVPKVG